MKSKERNYQIQTRLGSGSYGVIFKALNKTNKQVCVLKQIRMNKMSQKAKKSTYNEATIMGKLIHPFIVQYKQSFVENDTLNIVMEYCDGGDLSMYLKMQNKKPLKEQKIWKFFLQICLGLEYIHKNKILHRDIKSLNIFLNKNEEIKIGDLGVAKMLMANDFAQTIVGTPFYLSPQLCEQKPYNQKSDIWALGCLLYELCTFKHPFQAANQASLILKIIRGKYSPIPEFYSKQLKDVIDMCLQRDYKRRPTASMILQRSKVKEYIVEFKLQEKIQEQYQKIKNSKETPASQINQNLSSNDKKQPIKKPVITTTSQQKIVPSAKKQTNVQKMIPEPQNKQIPLSDKKAMIIQKDKKPSISGMPQNNIFLPDKNNIIEKLKPNNLIVPKKQINPQPQVINQQNLKKIQESKQDFLRNLQKVVNQNVQQKRSPVRQKPKQANQVQISLLLQQKNRLQKIDQKIQEQVKKQKEIQKNRVQSAKRIPVTPNLISPKVGEGFTAKINRKSEPFLIPKQSNKDSGKVQFKQNDNILIPPLPPKKQQIIKVKMQQPPIKSNVMDIQKNSENKNKGIIKSRGFTQQIQEQDINAGKPLGKRLIDFRHNEQEKVQKPVLFGLDEQEKDKKLHNNASEKKVTNQQAFPKNSQYHSERNIKAINQNNGNVSRIQVKKQQKQPAERYIFKKKPQILPANYNVSRIRKGSSSELSRNAKNVSKHSEVTKQDQNDVMNLPDSLNQNIVDSSDQQIENQKGEIKRKFVLKDINNDMVLQKYEQILSSKSIGNTEVLINSRKKQFQSFELSQQERNARCETLDLKPKQNDKETKKSFSNEIPLAQQKVLDAEINEMFNDKEISFKKPVDQLEFIPENESLAFKTQQYEDQNDEILDQSEEIIESEEKQLEQQVYEVNNFNLDDHEYQADNRDQQYQQNYENDNQQGQNQQTQSQWSFDQQPQLPMMEDKQSPFFEQANPYLVVQQEEQTVQQKRNYLQIRLSQNMKRQDEINKLMQIKIQECKAIVPKFFDEILEFFRKKINKDQQYTQNDQRQVEQFLRKKGLTDQRKFQNIYKIMHFEMQLQNTRKIIQRICKKLSQLDNTHQES